MYVADVLHRLVIAPVRLVGVAGNILVIASVLEVALFPPQAFTAFTDKFPPVKLLLKSTVTVGRVVVAVVAPAIVAPAGQVHK